MESKMSSALKVSVSGKQTRIAGREGKGEPRKTDP